MDWEEDWSEDSLVEAVNSWGEGEPRAVPEWKQGAETRHHALGWSWVTHCMVRVREKEGSQIRDLTGT